MKWVKQAWEFYKSARTDEEAAAEYKEFIAHHLLSASNDIVYFHIALDQNRPYFNIKDFLQPNAYWLLWSLNALAIQLGEQHIPRAIRPELIKEIINYKASLMLSKELRTGNYLDIEQTKNLVAPELMERAKRKIIMRLIGLFTRAQKSGMDTHGGLGKELIIEWRELYQNSKEISHEFLEELIKRFGMDFYVDAIEQSHSNKMTLQKFLTKNKDDITIYDIALLFNYVWLTAKDFKYVLNKIQHNHELRNFVRGYVYSGNSYGYSSERGDTPYFMLDESLKPMNDLYKTIAFPDQISPIHLHNVSEKYYDRWQQLFDEFHLIPS